MAAVDKRKPMGKPSNKMTLAMVLLASQLLLLAGCKCPINPEFHKTALSYFPKRTALCPPPPYPHYADPNFFGYHGTCWFQWPDGWVECPCTDLEEGVEGADGTAHGPEVLPPRLQHQYPHQPPRPHATAPLPAESVQPGVSRETSGAAHLGIASETILPVNY
jgi:hypothetical protein